MNLLVKVETTGSTRVYNNISDVHVDKEMGFMILLATDGVSKVFVPINNIVFLHTTQVNDEDGPDLDEDSIDDGEDA